jgi:hypothetical protein
LNEKFKEEGRMFSRGKVVKLRFSVPNNEPLSFFMFKEDVEKLLDDKLFYARIFLDVQEVDARAK